MDIMKVIASRKSVRGFKQDQIPDREMGKILLAGSTVPVGRGQFDSMHLTAVQTAESLKKIKDAVRKRVGPDKDMFYGAPVFIIVSAIEVPTVPDLGYCDTACFIENMVLADTVIENMILAATDMEIDSLYIWGAVTMIRDDEKLCRELYIPDGYRPVSGVALGYSSRPDNQAIDLSMKIKCNKI